jgi:pimeloyl-ACP methyl ester carboxylesterase
MHHIVEQHAPGAPAKCLVLLLPGAGDSDSTFREQGFIDALAATGASLDVVAANATMGYYFKGIAPARIEADVAAPSRALGAQKVWVVGMSMGGFGALSYAQQYTDHVDGVLALAPYLGAASLAKEVQDAGGLSRWSPDPKAPLTEANYQRQLWSWLHRLVIEKEAGPSLYVGYGDDDKLGAQDSVLANALPTGHVFHTPGGHDWAPWLALLKQFLGSAEFRESCAASAVSQAR